MRPLENSCKQQQGTQIWMSATEREGSQQHCRRGLQSPRQVRNTCLCCPSSLSPYREEEGPGAGKHLSVLSLSGGGTVWGWEKGYGHCTEVRLKF